MAAAPKVVQDTITSPVTQQELEQLGKQYALHIDVVGLLIKITSYMLLGYANPEESLQALRAAGISEQQARTLIDEINKRIFVPLRERMKSGAVQPAKPVVSAPQTPTPPRFFHLENKLAPRPSVAPSVGGPRGSAVPPRPVQQPVPAVPATPQPKPVQPPIAARPSPLAAAIGSVLNAQPKVAPQPPRPSSNIAPLPPKFVLPKSFGNQVSPKPSTLLEDHEEPHIELSKAPMPAKVAEEVVRPVAPSAPLQPRVAPPPPNLPGAMPPLSSLSMSSMPEVAEVHTLPIVPKAVPPMPPQSYTVDPYREPIE